MTAAEKKAANEEEGFKQIHKITFNKNSIRRFATKNRLGEICFATKFRLEILQYIGEVLRCGKTAKPSTRICPKDGLKI
ncbi:MAG: hypothetical protein AABX78_01170, partial [Nanoarchaeota archaeon]